MKTTITLCSLICTLCVARAQTNITLALVVNENGTRTTNTVALSSLQVKGLLRAFKDANIAQTNRVPALPLLTMPQFMLRELEDTFVKWDKLGSREDIAEAGFNRSDLPDAIAAKWNLMTAQQKAAVSNYLNFLKQ